MTQENSFFIEILADHLSKRKTEMRIDINWRIIVDLARKHQVEGIVYHQCKSFIPNPFRLVFEKAYSASLYYYKNRQYDLTILLDNFKNEKIPVITVKGVTVAKYYPVPLLRTMGDTDLIVPRNLKTNAGQVLRKLGYTLEFQFSGKEEGYIHQGISYDLHHQLIYDEAITLPEHKAFFNSCWNYVSNGELDHSFHFLFLLAHLRKHLMNEGVGIRQFMDLAVIANQDTSLSWDWIRKMLPELRMERFAEVCFSLIERWFGIRCPLTNSKLDDIFVENATKKILANGVFGFDDKSNQNNVITNQIRQYHGMRVFGRIKLILKRAFPGYKEMCGGEASAFLKGKPWLLPVAWIYRFSLMFSGKKTSGKKILSQILISGKKMDSREEELRHWGLL